MTLDNRFHFYFYAEYQNSNLSVFYTIFLNLEHSQIFLKMAQHSITKSDENMLTLSICCGPVNFFKCCLHK